MAIPLWAVNLALTAASVYAADRYQGAVEDEQDRLAAAENIRESGRQSERDAYLNALLGSMGREDVDQRTDERMVEREDNAEAVSNQAMANVDDYIGAGSAPQTVSNDIGGIISNYVKKGKDEIRRQARAGAFGDVQFDDSVSILRTGDELGMLDNFSQGGQRVLDTELRMAPRYAGRKWKTMSDVAGAGAAATGWYDIFNNAALAGASTTTRGAARNIPSSTGVVSGWGA